MVWQLVHCSTLVERQGIKPAIPTVCRGRSSVIALVAEFQTIGIRELGIEHGHIQEDSLALLNQKRQMIKATFAAISGTKVASYDGSQMAFLFFI